jgi:hypothetical protein
MTITFRLKKTTKGEVHKNNRYILLQLQGETTERMQVTPTCRHVTWANSLIPAELRTTNSQTGSSIFRKSSLGHKTFCWNLPIEKKYSKMFTTCLSASQEFL